MVGLWYYNQSGVTELLIMRDPHYGQMCFKSVKTFRSPTFLAVKNASASGLDFFHSYMNVELLELYPIHEVQVHLTQT